MLNIGYSTCVIRSKYFGWLADSGDPFAPFHINSGMHHPCAFVFQSAETIPLKIAITYLLLRGRAEWWVAMLSYGLSRNGRPFLFFRKAAWPGEC